MLKISFAIFLFALTFFIPAAHANLLTNPDFGTMDWQGWDIGAVPAGTSMGLDKRSYSWEYSAYANAAGNDYPATITFGQRLNNVIAGTSYIFGAYLLNDLSCQLYAGAKAWVGIDWYAGKGVYKGGAVTTALTGPNNDWEYFGSTSAMPADATYGYFSMFFYDPGKLSGNRRVWFDSAEVKAIPEPVSCFLFAVGGAALLARKRRSNTMGCS